MNNNIELISVQELLGEKFFIPSYQRGYRWTKQQVKDLLNDILEFQANGSKGVYCIQPLVVKGIPKKNAIEAIRLMYNDGKKPSSTDEIRKELNPEKWEVIDGQQRLTTVKIILNCLGYKNDSQTYDLEYKTRCINISSDNMIKRHIGSKEFLSGISGEKYTCGTENKTKKEIAESNIDFYHMYEAYNTVSDWFDEKCKNCLDGSGIDSKEFKDMFCKTLKEKVQFIWYETQEEDPIKVFTRLNIGKIPLTDAELIKALFLNQSNFKNENQDTIRLQQVEIANEWDIIEYTLQNDEFWLFIQNETHYNKPTRIDFIFDLIRDQKRLGDNGDCGDDEHITFRYFYNYFNQNKNIIDAEWLRKTWLLVKEYFRIFEEWYNDVELYHYIGCLVEHKIESIQSLAKEWINNTRTGFISHVKETIKNYIKNVSNLLKQYELNKCPKKTSIRPILILHNVQTIINQNKKLIQNDDYKQGVFIKFPFHLLKKEKWDVEHIDSNTINDLSDPASQKEFLINCYWGCHKDIQKKIEEFFNNPQDITFDDLKKELVLPKDTMTHEQKNQLMNFTLLDSSTNRGYGNAIFPAKRRIIKGKDLGKIIPMPKIDKEGHLVKSTERDAISSFIPPCTKQVFMKYYSDELSSTTDYSLTDAIAYLLDINSVLSNAGFINDQKKEIENILTKEDK